MPGPVFALALSSLHLLPGKLRALEGEYRDYGTQMLEAEGKRDGKNTIVEVSQSGTVPKSFVITALAPSIDYNLKFTFDPNGRVNVSGSHDGFPAYEVYMDKVLLYSHNARQTNEGVMSLFPPMEHDIDEDCDGRRQPPPWYKPLLPYPFNRGFPF